MSALLVGILGLLMFLGGLGFSVSYADDFKLEPRVAQARVMSACAVMISGSVCFAAGVLGGRRRFVYAPVPGQVEAPDPTGAPRL